MERVSVRRGASLLRDPAGAVEEVRSAIDQTGTAVVLLFCSPAYDLDALGKAIGQAFACPVVGCTSAGQIGEQGYQRGGITAVSVASDELEVHPFLISPLSECRERAVAVAARAQAVLARLPEGRRAFGLLLADGLSLAEEGLTATLYQSLGDVPLVGGSAGDDLKFERTHVYWEGTFRSNAAVLAIFGTSLRFVPLKLQHFRPTARKLVITAAEVAQRLVREMDGYPAADAYADAVGVAPEQLDAATFSAHPLMLRIGSDHYVRSISQVNPDRSLTFFCAIDEGLVLSVGEGLDPVASLEAGLREASRGLTRPALTIGCDCVLRRLELERRDLCRPVEEVLVKHGVIGFSTYGEQFNAIHVNQTFTGMIVGE